MVSLFFFLRKRFLEFLREGTMAEITELRQLLEYI